MRMKFNTPMAQKRIERIQFLLRREDLTSREISDGIHLSYRTTQGYVQHLRELGLIHVSYWRKYVQGRGACDYVPVYGWGEAKDAKKPPKIPKAVIDRKYLSNPEVQDRLRAKRIAKQIRPHRDWSAAWIPTQAAR